MKLVRIVLFIVHLVVLSLLAGTIFNAYISPKSFPYFNFLSLGFPFLMISNVLLIVFWIFSFKKRAVVFIIITVFFLTPIRRWINYVPKTETKGKIINVITFNNKNSFYGKARVESFLDSKNADVIMLQEAGYGNNNEPKLNHYEHQIHGSIVSFYTNHKILKQGDIDFLSNGEAKYLDVEIEGKIIRFINIYLEPFQLHKSMVKPSSSIEVNEVKAKGLVKRFIPVFKIHSEQVDILKEFIQQSPYPVILGGDFNSVPNSYEYYTINSLLNDAFLDGGSGSGTSFHDYKFPIRIDYLFTSKEIICQKYSIDRTEKMSDHYPVLAEFSFKN